MGTSKYLNILADFMIEQNVDGRKVLDMAQHPDKMGRTGSVYCLYSYGKDSGSVLDWAYKQKIPNFKGALAINTTIHIPEWPKLVREHCDSLGYDCTIISRADGGTFEDCSLEYGFGGPGMHSTIMRYLKLDPLRALQKRDKEDKILFLSGIRLDESKKRFGTVKPVSSDHGWFVAPLYNWPNEKVAKYVEENKISKSPAYETLELSGDCLCGCNALPGEFRLIEIFYPEIAARIKRLEELVRKTKAYYLWGDRGIELRKEIKICKKTGKAVESMVCAECGYR